ncbi:MAG: cupredoxin domain-containing protein [Chloroflexota bacterium]
MDGRARNLFPLLLALAVTACGFGASASSPSSPASSAAGPVVDRSLTAKDLELHPAELTAPSGSVIALAFDNADPDVPHGLALYGDAAHTVTLGTAEVIVGPAHQVFQIAALPPGRYQFSCVVHPATMVADLVVEP